METCMMKKKGLAATVLILLSALALAKEEYPVMQTNVNKNSSATLPQAQNKKIPDLAQVQAAAEILLTSDCTKDSVRDCEAQKIMQQAIDQITPELYQSFYSRDAKFRNGNFLFYTGNIRFSIITTKVSNGYWTKSK